MADAQLGSEYRSWILRHAQQGYAVSSTDRDHIELSDAKAKAFVTFYELDENEPEIVELRIQRVDCDCEDLFFLHFELEDEARAEELFGEMLEVFDQQGRGQTVRVLLCCTAGFTTTMFAGKLSEAAQNLSLDMAFEALPLEQALANGAEYAAILLAPQVGYRRKEIVAAYPGKVVFEIPAKIFGAYDAAAALHLLLSALDEDARAARGASPDTKIERDLSNDKRILVISVVHRPKGARIGYRLYEHGETTLDGHVYKKRINYRDLEDVAAAIRVMGYRISELDAVGVAIPGTVHEGTVRLTAVEDKPFDLKGYLEEALEVPVFVENNANAAAVGCYVTQDDYETIVLHTQRTGALVGGQGTIVNGRLVRGRLGGAGELGYVARRLDMWDNVRELCWSPEGLCKIVAEFLLCSISSVAPEAAYVAVEMIPDPEPLRAELAKTTPVDYIPELIPVDDYHERIMIGELALCLNALRNGGDATKKKA